LQAQARLEPLTMASDEPLALLGGTFDPVHYGHLRLADEVSRALAPIEVRLVPARDPPHRGAPHASAAHRLAMLRLAQQEFPELVVDAREIERPGKSYTVLTLEGLRAEMPARPLVLIVGADQLLALTAWHRWQALFDLAHLLVVARRRCPACPAVGRDRDAARDASADLGNGHTPGSRGGRNRRRARFAPARRFGLYSIQPTLRSAPGCSVTAS
jgi:cytidyltransferase-like protein